MEGLKKVGILFPFGFLPFKHPVYHIHGLDFLAVDDFRV